MHRARIRKTRQRQGGNRVVEGQLNIAASIIGALASFPHDCSLVRVALPPGIPQKRVLEGVEGPKALYAVPTTGYCH
jgi:hypothetical protein